MILPFHSTRISMHFTAAEIEFLLHTCTELWTASGNDPDKRLSARQRELLGRVPDDMHESPGNAVSVLVGDAVRAAAIVGDPDLELQVNGDGDADSSGFYVLLHNRHGRQRMVGLHRMDRIRHPRQTSLAYQRDPGMPRAGRRGRQQPAGPSDRAVMTVWMLLGPDGRPRGLYRTLVDLLKDLGVGAYSVAAIIDRGGSEIVLISGGETLRACEQCVVTYTDSPDDNTYSAMWTVGRDITVTDWNHPATPAAVTPAEVRVVDDKQADSALHQLGYLRIETWNPTENTECFLARIVAIDHL